LNVAFHNYKAMYPERDFYAAKKGHLVDL